MALKRRGRQKSIRVLLAIAMLSGGCRARTASFIGTGKGCSDTVAGDYYASAAADIDYPAINQCSLEECSTGLDSLAPRTLNDKEPASYRDITLDEVIQTGLASSSVMRDLGGAVLVSPDATRTAWDPAVQETNPATGVEAALSEFDAQFTTSFFAENNDRALNNEFFGGGTRILTQDAAVQQAQISKRSVTGTELAARQIIEYDANNAPGNLFDSAYTVKVEGEVRHPLMQGAGMEFNRIAGPTRTPGVYNGVLIARIKTDVQIADFEIAVRNLVSNLENAYWDLYFAYRDLDAKIAARDAALDTWRRVQALYESGRRGGEAEKEAQAREQYYRFQEEVENALTGRRVDGTRTGNGSLAGTFRGNGGVYISERRLRRLMNLPISDGVLLRPQQQPVVAQIDFDWEQVMFEAVDRRAELRRQKWGIRARELELIASKNHLMPRLDAVGRYRFRGFGKDLLPDDPLPAGTFNNAYENLTSGDFQEWQLGLELDIPIGFRQAHSAVRNAELLLARERALLSDQQQEVIHDCAAAVGEVARAYQVSQTSYNRLIAARSELEALKAAFEADKAPLNLYLDAQRRLAESESRYHRSVTEYAVSIKNTHFAKGTLLEFDGVFLSEGPWPGKAYCDAADLESRRGRSRPLNYASQKSLAVSQGAFEQHRPACEPSSLFGVPVESTTASEATGAAGELDSQVLPLSYEVPSTTLLLEELGVIPALHQPEAVTPEPQSPTQLAWPEDLTR